LIINSYLGVLCALCAKHCPICFSLHPEITNTFGWTLVKARMPRDEGRFSYPCDFSRPASCLGSLFSFGKFVRGP
jgi:hypothetical protein